MTPTIAREAVAISEQNVHENQPQCYTPLGVNLKSCAHYQLYSGKAAEAELRVLLQNVSSGGEAAGAAAGAGGVGGSSPQVFLEHDLLRHNICVFRSGENAMQVLPALLDIIPEARLNLVIYYLKAGSWGIYSGFLFRAFCIAEEVRCVVRVILLC